MKRLRLIMLNINITKIFTVFIIITGIISTSKISVFSFNRITKDEFTFRQELERNKGNKENIDNIYSDYITFYFKQAQIDMCVKLIKEFENKYPDSKYIDDYEWFNLNIKKYFLHSYPEVIDCYVNLIEKYNGVDLDLRYYSDGGPGIALLLKDNLSGKITKEYLISEMNEFKNAIKHINELKEDLKTVEEEIYFTKYFELGKLYRDLNDLKSAEEWYLKGVNDYPDNEKTAELLYELGEMYRFKGLKKIPIKIMALDSLIERYYGYNESYKKAQKYYFEIYKKFPKSKLAPRGLEQAGDLYTMIVSGTRNPTEEEYQMRKGIEEDPGATIPVYDIAKASETYEKIWKEYPGYENLKEVLKKLVSAMQEKGINYYEKYLVISKEIYGEEDKEIREYVNKANIYKKIYNKEPNLDLPANVSMEVRIKQLNELIGAGQMEEENK